MVRSSCLLFAMFFCSAGRVLGAEPGDSWQKIAPFFRPPAEIGEKLGSYRPVLRFENGTPVKDAADWPKRRTEILDTWNTLMGPWPLVIGMPKVEVLERSQ